ncbi:serine O-acetyltransferase [Neobacillus sp. NPDC093182]|uniref:serine O-acetyltransferase n=1 Tax=Neobacillus sp. NPDC093182 TaxID=3364297 RepID=UPI0037F7E8C3
MNKEGSFLKFIRLYQFLYKKKLKAPGKFLALVHKIVFSCDIPPSCELGTGTKFPHFALGVVLHPRCKIGNNTTIYQHVTIGSRNGLGPPIIGNDVLIGSGAVIIGDIVIGNNVNIGANSVVTKSIPDNSTVVGIPGKIVQN